MPGRRLRRRGELFWRWRRMIDEGVLGAAAFGAWAVSAVWPAPVWFWGASAAERAWERARRAWAPPPLVACPARRPVFRFARRQSVRAAARTARALRRSAAPIQGKWLAHKRSAGRAAAGLAALRRWPAPRQGGRSANAPWRLRAMAANWYRASTGPLCVSGGLRAQKHECLLGKAVRARLALAESVRGRDDARHARALRTGGMEMVSRRGWRNQAGNEWRRRIPLHMQRKCA